MGVEEMLLVYDSLTGNVQRFIRKIPQFPSVKITPNLVVNEPFILVTYTINFGQVPQNTKQFLERNGHYLKGVASSGNRNWGTTYCKAADILSNTYHVPILLKFELSGTDNDIKQFIMEVENIVSTNS
jgi:protein involved in ribonucleotide reduction